MNRKPVASSNIKSIGHDPDKNELEVEFNGGAAYRYSDVSADKYQKLLNADSLGKHFHAHIRNQHAVSKV